MDTPELIELSVTAVAHGGVFVGRYGARTEGAEPESRGRVVFVPDTMPGERVLVRLTDTSKKAFWRGEVVEVMDASPHRQPHIWPSADLSADPATRPGGADFGHIELGHQRALKAEVVSDAVRRFAQLDLPVTVAPVEDETPDGTRWRTRVSLHIDADGRIGPFAARSHRVVTPPDLPLATPAIERAALRGRDARPGRIDLVQPTDGRVRVIPRPESGARRGKSAVDPATRETIVEMVGDREFRVDAGGFWQVHRRAAATLTDAVTTAIGELDPDGWHLDLYGGVGLLAAAVAGVGGASTRITTVEADARATEHAGENLAEWIGARAESARVDRWLAHLDGTATAAQRDRLARGVVVLDPPRAGAGADVVRRLAALAPTRIVYVACDPVALARDVKTFSEHGYALDTITGFDLFPNSHHVETVATFTARA